ncbi:hypothetical protein V6N13_020307 [Hibiscus sabdariffa]
MRPILLKYIFNQAGLVVQYSGNKLVENVFLQSPVVCSFSSERGFAVELKLPNKETEKFTANGLTTENFV